MERGGREERGLKRMGMYKKELKWKMEWGRWTTGHKISKKKNGK